ncbi:putative Protein arginine N-methyltransferase 6 [Paratrimastix pyriformis]|uniref:U-box domain-containing protein n=1 Tax=Paratrimastix pyriformis TaxID=342808 RepID=A0ABQ8USN4_9EUKA|nr:putative Protein arginine N-methyltransferase 6 [Paratrimastix pyriformis]
MSEDQQYFHSYCNVNIHEMMISDTVRTDSYKRAFEAASDDIRGRVCLDVGTGTGILAHFLLQCGAKKVYAVEASDMALQAREIARINGVSDRLIVIQGRIEDVTLPEQVDVIVSEWMGYCAIYECMLDSVLVARDRFLRPGGILLPTSFRIWGCPIGNEEIHEERAECWHDVYGIHMTPLMSASHAMPRRLSPGEPDRGSWALLPMPLFPAALCHRSSVARRALAAEPEIAPVAPEWLMSDPVLLGQFQCATVSPTELKNVSAAFRSPSFVSSEVSGIAIWFDVTFASPAMQRAQTAVVLSTAPTQPLTHWQQTALYLEAPLEVQQGDSIVGSVTITQSRSSQRGLDFALRLELETTSGQSMAKRRKLVTTLAPRSRAPSAVDFLNMDPNNIPNEFFCPITMEMMRDPVIASDGHTYERAAIEEWLHSHETSPVTRKPMTARSLIPNIALRNTIETLAGGAHPRPDAPHAAAPRAAAPRAPHALANIDLSVQMSPANEGISTCSIVVNPPVNGERRPCACICVIDVSGSMQLEAPMKDSESAGLTRLDLVKHSVRTCMALLESHDMLALVAFSSSARVVLPLTAMNDAGKSLASHAIDSLDASGATNIWDGIRVAMDISRMPLCAQKNVHTLLLTDGEPNENPPRGIIPTFRKALAGSMLGTCFVNFIANTLAAASPSATLQLAVRRGAHLVRRMGFEGPCPEAIPLGAIQFGQARTEIIQLKDVQAPEDLEVTLRYEADGHPKTVAVRATAMPNDTAHEFLVQRSRLDTCDAMRRAIGLGRASNVPAAQQAIATMGAQLGEGPAHEDGRLVALVKDLEGQVREAFSREDWWQRWGRHYVPSLLRAHQLQQCSNFKDPGVQLYGGRLFADLQDRADDLFCKLPPPVGSIQSASDSFGASAAAAAAPARPINMAEYLNPSRPCFAGTSPVLMADGRTRCISLLKKGDRLAGVPRSVRCVVESICPTGRASLVALGPMLVTPWHPVQEASGAWVFPADIHPPTARACDAVYNLVLDGSHGTATVGGRSCATLGHGLAGPVVGHPYFGTAKVLADLKRMRGWEAGRVLLGAQAVVERDPATGLVSGIKQ